jgi:hypothetical protein
MNVKNLLTVNAIYVALIALVSIFGTSFLVEQNGMEVNDATINLMRVVGALAVGYGVASWLMRNAQASLARRAFLIGGGVGYFVVAAVFVFNYFSSDLGNATTWVYVVISLLLGLDFIFFGMKDPATE